MVNLRKPWATVLFCTVQLFWCSHAVLVDSHPFCTTLDLQLSFYRRLCYNSRAHCPLLQCLHTASAILAGAHSYFVVVYIANAHIKIGSNSYEKVETFKYLGSLLTNQNSVQEEMKCRLKAGNSCCHSVQTLLSSRLLSKNLKIKIYKTIILLIVLNGCEAWCLILMEKSRLRIFENRVLRWIFLPKRDENGEWRKLHYEEHHSLYRSPVIVRMMSRRPRWAGHVARMEESRSSFKF